MEVARSVDHRPVFARRLLQARTAAGLSQRQLGIRAGLEPSVASPRVNQYEQGKHEPRPEAVKRLAEALGIPPAFLYTDDDLLARLLQRWGELSLRERKALVQQVEAPAAKTARPARKAR
jgi:transcriptional regulator with XRE-family HTH domain